MDDDPQPVANSAAKNIKPIESALIQLVRIELASSCGQNVQET
jgi:hypothetical protein